MQKLQIVFDSLIVQKLDNIFNYLILNESLEIANSVLDNLEDSIESLEYFPDRFSRVFEESEFGDFEVRNIFCSSFRIIYVVLSQQVRIVDVRHAAMEPLSKKDIITSSWEFGPS